MLNESVACVSDLSWVQGLFSSILFFFDKLCVAVMSVEKLPVFVLCVEGGVLVSVHLPGTTRLVLREI